MQTRDKSLPEAAVTGTAVFSTAGGRAPPPWRRCSFGLRNSLSGIFSPYATRQRVALCKPYSSLVVTCKYMASINPGNRSVNSTAQVGGGELPWLGFVSFICSETGPVLRSVAEARKNRALTSSG